MKGMTEEEDETAIGREEDSSFSFSEERERKREIDLRSLEERQGNKKKRNRTNGKLERRVSLTHD